MTSATPKPRVAPLEIAALMFVTANTGYFLLAVFTNLTDYQTNFAFVQHVLSMDTINFGQNPGENLPAEIMWRAITNPALWHIAYIFIIMLEAAVTVTLLGALAHFYKGWRTRNFYKYRTWATIALSMVVLLFGVGFLAIGGEWFQMWRSHDWNGLDPAFRNTVLAGLTLALVNLPIKSRQQETV